MIHQQLLDDAKASLMRGIALSIGQNELESVFAAWLAPDAVPLFERNKLIASIVTAEKRSYSQTAAMGVAAQTGNLEATAVALLKADLEQLCGREPVVEGTPMPFCMDGVALAGIILGTQVLGDDAVTAKVAEWLGRCRKVTAGGKGLEDWQEWLLMLLGSQTALIWEAHRPISATASVVSVALRSRGFGRAIDLAAEKLEEQDALRVIQTESATDLPLGCMVLRLAALRQIRRMRPVANLRCASSEDVVRILRRLPDGFQRWTWEDKPRTKTSPEGRKWHVENEYHVQNILWLLLASVFPDLVPEDYTPKVGPVQPRADIGLPSLRIIVEAKFMRASDAPKVMIEQIAEDASLYLVPGSRYDRIIPFIWDDSRRSEHHEDMLRGLRQIRGVLDAVIIPRPGTMEHQSKKSGDGASQ
jgi:hypothetical protein